jgi:hypothetical protein
MSQSQLVANLRAWALSPDAPLSPSERATLRAGVQALLESRGAAERGARDTLDALDHQHRSSIASAERGCDVCGAAPGQCMTATICQQEREARKPLPSSERCRFCGKLFSEPSAAPDHPMGCRDDHAAPSATRASYAEIAGAVARGWCSPNNAHKEMDSELAFAITVQIVALLGIPNEADRGRA